MKPQLSSLIGRALPFHPDRLRGLIAQCREPLDGSTRRAASGKSSSPAKNGYELMGSTAVIQIAGYIFQDALWQEIFEYWGVAYTDPRDVAALLLRAAGDRAVDSVLLLVDSPGGEISGVQAAAEAVWAFRQNAGKPIAAHTTGLNASAAYWISSQAAWLSAEPTAEVGSIGVYTAIEDLSGLADKLGIKVLVVSSGPHKGSFVPGTEVTPEQLVPVQQAIDDLAALFRADVARGRGASAERVAEWATGQVWVAGRAQGLGLIDSVEGLGSALADIGEAHLSRSAAASPAPQASGEKEDTMPEEKKQAEAAPAPKAAEPTADLQAEAKAAGLEEGKKQAVGALEAMLAAFPKDQAFALESFRKGLSVEQAKAAYADVLAARNEQLSADLAKAKTAQAESGAEPAPFTSPEAGSAASAASGTRASFEAEYAASAELQAEFEAVGGKKAYVAYATRKAAGLIHGKGRGA